MEELTNSSFLGTGNYDVINETANFHNSSALTPDKAATMKALIGLSLLFCLIGILGLVGNSLVIFIIVSNKKMRRSVTNLFIMNLAVADLLIMLFGIPEIIQFMINRGWLLGLALCKFQRYILVVALYVSIMTLVALCVERYIAIMHPIKAHILCSRRRILMAMACIWPVALASGLPTALFNQVLLPHERFPVALCLNIFPGDTRAQSKNKQMIFKLAEFTIYFFIPVLVQIVLYSIVCKQLFAKRTSLHRKQMVLSEDGSQREKDSDAIRARKGVVRMLVAIVIVYIASYTPAQIPLFYDIISSTPFKSNWSFLVLVMTLGYINSAANPIIYGIFSQNFRQNFQRLLCCYKTSTDNVRYRQASSQPSLSSQKATFKTSTSHVNTTFTSVSEIGLTKV